MAALRESYLKGLDIIGSALNYGAAGEGTWMTGHAHFLEALATFLADQYGKPVDAATLMSTSGASMAADLIARVHCAAGDIAVTEAPTYYLAHQMFRERGMALKEVPLQPDGMDLDALEALCEAEGGKVKLVYTVPVHHNPTGVTMCQAKRVRLAALARKHKFFVIADEAYQLLNFEPTGVVPLYYEDDASDPRVLSVGTFSKLIGPGIKVGWIQAHPSLIKPVSGIGFINSGNNPVTFSSVALAHFVRSGALKEHIAWVARELGRKRTLLCDELAKVGVTPTFGVPKGGYFVWAKRKEGGGKMTGRNGVGMTLEPRDRFADWMRLCFAWLTDEQIVAGVRYLAED